jgi:hypothetical protein
MRRQLCHLGTRRGEGCVRRAPLPRLLRVWSRLRPPINDAFASTHGKPVDDACVAQDVEGAGPRRLEDELAFALIELPERGREHAHPAPGHLARAQIHDNAPSAVGEQGLDHPEEGPAVEMVQAPEDGDVASSTLNGGFKAILVVVLVQRRIPVSALRCRAADRGRMRAGPLLSDRTGVSLSSRRRRRASATAQRSRCTSSPCELQLAAPARPPRLITARRGRGPSRFRHVGSAGNRRPPRR